MSDNSDIKIVDDFLKRAEVFYVATTIGDQPKCRPFGYHYLDDGKLYFTSGTFKDVFKQIQANPKVEIAAYDGDKFLRYYGIAKIVKNDKIVERAFEELPEVGKIFKDYNLELGVFYLDNATAEIRNQIEIEESYKFEYWNQYPNYTCLISVKSDISEFIVHKSPIFKSCTLSCPVILAKVFNSSVDTFK